MRRFIAFIKLWLLLIISAGAYGQTLVISTGEWSPLVSQAMANDGPIAQVVKEAFALEGVAIEFVYRPWSRSYQEAKAGSAAVASFPWRRTEKRQQEVLFSDEIYAGINVFFHLKSTPFEWETFADLKDYRVGGAIGYSYGQAFEDAANAEQFPIFRVAEEKQLIPMLLNQRIGVFPANREVGLQLIQQHAGKSADDIAFHPKVITSKPLFLVAPKSSKGQALIEVFNRGLKKLKDSGRYERIYLSQ